MGTPESGLPHHLVAPSPLDSVSTERFMDRSPVSRRIGPTPSRVLDPRGSRITCRTSILLLPICSLLHTLILRICLESPLAGNALNPIKSRDPGDRASPYAPRVSGCHRRQFYAEQLRPLNIQGVIPAMLGPGTVSQRDVGFPGVIQSGIRRVIQWAEGRGLGGNCAGLEATGGSPSPRGRGCR